METSLERIRNDIERIGEFTQTPGAGCTRFSYSEEDKKAREYLIGQMKDLGLNVVVDAVGNIRARLEGTNSDAPVIMMGSHIDTVLHGGKFDGVVGVVSALEVIRVLVENKIKNSNPIELIIFSEEEGSNFGATLAGSKALIGKYKIDDIKRIKNDKGISLYDAAKAFGLNPEEVDKYVLNPNEVKAMIEMHVEQAAVLDSEKIPVGIVEAIAGIKWFKVELQGIGNHAGATPMHLRHDAMTGASKIISAIESITKEKAFSTTVGTVGKIHCEPNVPNIIPEKVSFTIDVRDVNPEGIDIVVREVKSEIDKISQSYGLKANIELMGEADSVRLSSEVVNLIDETAKAMGIVYKRMNSGAVHDATCLAGITKVGMIFVPSINGRSHVPEELTNYEDIKLGCDLLLNVALKLAN